MSGPLTSAAQARMRWIKTRPTLPSWWEALQVVLGVIFFAYLGFALVTSGSSGTPHVAAGRNLGHGVVLGPTTAPAATAAAATATSGEPIAPATTPPAAALVTLFDSSGAPVQVPSAAVALARRAMLGAFNPAELVGLPVVHGFTPAAPVQTYKHPVAGPLTVLTHSDTAVTFVAKVDPDGTQRFLTDTQASVVLQSGVWVYTNVAG